MKPHAANPPLTTRRRTQAIRRRPFIGTLRSRGQSTCELEHPPHAGMSKVGSRPVHHRTPAGDNADLVLPAVVDGRWRDAGSGACHGLVHPDASHAGIGALVDDLFGDLWTRDDHHAVDAAGNRLAIGIAAVA